MRWAWLAGLPGWVLGVALQLQQAALWPWWAYALLLCAPMALWAVSRFRGRAQGLALAVLAGGLIGFGLTGARAVHFASQALDPAQQGADIELTGRVASLPQRLGQGERFDFIVESAARAGAPVHLPERVQLGWISGFGSAAGEPPREFTRQGPGVRAGDRWRFTVRLRSPHGLSNPHGFDRERWLWEQGLQATGHVKLGPRDPAPQRLGASGLHPMDALRQSVSERIDERVDDPRSAGVLAALVVGDQSAIDRADWTLFRTTGVAHLMSISGLHVTMFAWLATALLAWGWRRLAPVWPQALLSVPVPVVAGLGGVVLAVAYALFSGWGVPAQRTVVMLAVVVGLRLGVRHWPWPVVWLLAMSAVLLLDPWALMQPGFWLSFVAVGILFATDPGRSRGTAPGGPLHRRAVRALVNLLREQGVVTLALAPLTLLLFGQFSVVGLLANLGAIPLVTLLITPLALLGVALPPLWDAAAWVVQGMSVGLQWLGQWSWAAVFRPAAPWPLAVAAVAGGALLVLRLPWVVRSAGLLLLAPALLYAPPRPAPGQFELIALDVGQGSAVLVRTEAHSLLFDTGPSYGPDSDAGERVVLPLLRALGERLDAVVVSHRDSDHAGGAEAVRAAHPQARWLSSYSTEAAERCLAGQRWTWDGVRFEVLRPLPEDYGPEGQGLLSTNAMSCVLRVASAQHSAWLGGDIDAAREVQLALARPDDRATVLLAPHHGSLTSSSPVLLNTLQPRWVLVQSGYRNRFGHPAPAVLERYQQRGMRWVTSPDCGAATWRSAEPDAVRCHREQDRRYWHHTGPAAAAGLSAGGAPPPARTPELTSPRSEP
ncbi:DNA internalization-related competence protein ComEC/Rec2 [Hydrogenophaga sp. PBL-H3]|uniref:DNA internalization-related competence protein ComEC/Rec2 n=1 Tax=Hydrogenophaga sp. PBL-H3 TaxID=434010 RepID=UPI00132049C7|nr:DNA internalization-related competence protein ComEC/Rec2 [Hydrogenophaga sp. PBL-H3]QHE75662.1 DNA internalization-related competence protein ComEC/Rec2 [Hydrogenophaga sp. PBL-H3]QHE80088.1 DNA internalization-related competence protein ComEC/Rec2 [Hydrogenophaga sp. PBL-H3]